LELSVEDNGDVYFVPAFSGLFAPYWRPDARGVVVGLTRFATKAHLARAAIESAAFQTSDVLAAMAADSGVELSELRVDGGMTANDTLMQFQADLLGVDVVRPVTAETTALGVAFGAGLATGVWSTLEDIRAMWSEDARWSPRMGQEERERLHGRWRQAVERSFDWV
jgi:glycerol kinase